MFNSAAANSIYNLNNNKMKIDNVLNQIQTGNRINKAADDSSGMTIADNLRMQANSLQQGTRNANDAKSLMDIADGAVTSYKDTLGLMKDKAMSAASDASSAESRNALQKDINNFMSSLNTIAKDTSFNGIGLLNGTFANKHFQVGAYSNQTVNVTLGSLETNKIGHFNETKSDNGVTSGTTDASLSINGETIGQVTISATEKDGANLLADSINLKESSTGVTAKAENSVSGGVVTGGSIADGDISINGVSIGAVNISSNDSTGTLEDAINSISAQTGVSARNEAGKMVLESENGENIHITEANAGAAKAGLTAGENYGTVTLSAQGAVSIENATAVSGLDATTTTNHTLSDIDLSSQEGAQKALDIIDYALREVNREASNVGSATNQLDRTIEINNITEQNVRSAEAGIREADMEELSNTLSNLQVKDQAAMFSLSKSNELQMNVLNLLR